MLGYGGIPKAEQLCEVSDGSLAVNQLTDDQQTVAIGERLQQIARGHCGGFHHVDLYFHSCIYTNIRIYSQLWSGKAEVGWAWQAINDIEPVP